MDIDKVCGTCLQSGGPLVAERVDESWTGVCAPCRAIFRKMRKFQMQCAFAAQLLHDFSTTEHTNKDWDEFVKSHEQQINKDFVGHFETSNTLCLDIVPHPEDTENFITQITSHCKTKTSRLTNQCEGMIEKYSFEVNKDAKKRNKKSLLTINGHQNGVVIRHKKERKAKKLKDKVVENINTNVIVIHETETCGSDGDERLQGDLPNIIETDEQQIQQNINNVHQRDDKISSERDLSKSVTHKTNKKKVRMKDVRDDVSRKEALLDHPDFESMFVCRTNLSLEEQLEEMERKKVSEEFLSSPFKCYKCFIGFKFQYSLDNHTKKHMQESGPIMCVVCTQRFSTQNKYREHVRCHHSQVLQCVLCGKRLKERKRLRDHWEAHQGITHTCDTCKKGFKTKTALIHHIGIHNSKFPCPHCPLVLRSRPTFKKHLLLHSSVRPHSCQACPRTFATREWLELHTQRAHAPTTEQFYCVECDHRFKSSREYKKHLTAKKHTHPSLLTYGCPRCPRRYTSQEDLSRHTSALHDRVLTYSCPECPARFATTRGLYGHKRRVHMGYVAPKKYSCAYCNKAFRDKYYLTNHTRIHTGDNTHKCTLCLLTFTHASALTHHLKQAHRDSV